jgi:putative NIF3 family GTP cyclohydrolase 1 type 2
MIDKLAAAALLLGAQGAATQPECLPRAQAAQMAVSLVPALIESAARACAAHLPAGAFLGSGSQALAERLGADTAAVRANAVAMILGLTGQAPAPGLDQGMMIRTFADGLTEGLDAAQCRGASEMLEAMAPLPTANIAQAVSAALGVAMARAGEDGPPICRE